ncbi:hypothetical protein A9F13_04g00979 [Clavispora lusitaniae]|uniref:Uncharacterized protein n=1 Tax=Clavispora lusitaniae TaxID=36911 RepID=A0AA91T311_CLALS|nr:hypothetical protein A9F13_04g00979 [Clavispora lusitaniae]
MAVCLVLEDIQNSSQWMHTLVGSRSNLHLNCGDAKSRSCAGAAILTRPKVRFRGQFAPSRLGGEEEKKRRREEEKKKRRKEEKEEKEEKKRRKKIREGREGRKKREGREERERRRRLQDG